MKRFTLSMVIMVMVFGTVSLDVYAKGNGRSSGRSGRSGISRSSHSGSRQSFQRRAPQQSQSRSRSRQSLQRSTKNDSTTRDHRVGKVNTTRDHRNTTTRPQLVNSAPKPRPTMKPIDTGIGNGKPGGGGFTRPIKDTVGGIKPRPGNGTTRPIPKPGIGVPKPRPGLKPLDPGIGNGKPGNGVIRPLPVPGSGAPKPRPNPKPPVGNGPPKPRPIPIPGKPVPGKPMPGNPHQGGGHGNGNGHGNHHGHHHNKPWHAGRPNYSWWWFNYCTPLRNCGPANYQYCNYVYPTCDYVAPNGQIVEDARWFLGMKGLMLPGKGIGVESVEANSPAADVGLTPGMVITKCNGVDITDDAVFGQVIAESGGVLEMELLETIDGPQLEATVQMIRLPTANF